MKPSFTEYNAIVADACQILAIAEIQYGDLDGVHNNQLRAQFCRTLRISLGNSILEAGKQFQGKLAEPHIIEEKIIHQLKTPLSELGKKLPSLVKELRQVADSRQGQSFLAQILFSEANGHDAFGIQRLYNNLVLLAEQERKSRERSYGFGAPRLIANIFMQPYRAIECEWRANLKLAELIAARIDQTAAMNANGRIIPDTHPGLLNSNPAVLSG